MVRRVNKSGTTFDLVAVISISILIIIGICFFIHNDSTLIKTSIGNFTGVRIKRLEQFVNCYFGIPYAEPPIGDLRFAKPKPKPRLRSTWRATNPPKKCHEVTIDSMSSGTDHITQRLSENTSEFRNYRNIIHSEDCLYLNIFVKSSAKRTSNLTVMVWIYGGTFTTGSISNPLYDGSVLASFADVIVVTINYRLGIFGFLSANELELEGNYGLHDQVLALKWIKKHIKNFGGNPNNIVLFGGLSIGSHIMSGLSKNLFNRAILESANPIVLPMINDKNFTRKVFIDAIKTISCNSNSTQPNIYTTLSCIRSVDEYVLQDLQMRFANNQVFFLPVEDNELFESNQMELIKDHKFKSIIDIIIGTNSFDDSRTGELNSFRKVWSMSEMSSNFTINTIMNTLRERLSQKYQSLIPNVIDFMFDGIDDKNDSHKLFNRYTTVLEDMEYKCSNYMFIREYLSTNASIYYYEFNQKPSIDVLNSKWMSGSEHSEEIFVFGLPLIEKGLFSPTDIELSKAVMTAWTQFAINGTAAFSDKMWTQFKRDEPNYLSINSFNTTIKVGIPGLKCDQYFPVFYELMKSFATDYERRKIQ